MLFRVFTLTFDPASEGFDDTPVRDYLADKDVLSMSEHFFTQDGRAYLAVTVKSRAVRGPASPATEAKPRQRDESWRKLVSKDDMALFERLREWRGERARAAGIPSYVICNNKQLAQVLQRRPATLAALSECDGFGDAKVKKYGEDILRLLAAAEPKAEADDATT